MELQDLIKASLGDLPASLLIENAQLVNTITGEIYDATITVFQDRIAYVGKPEDFPAEKRLDAGRRFVIPGMIDTHLHIESSMVTPSRFAENVVTHGTTTVCADPHEIANVFGKEGVKMMLENSRDLPVRIFYYAPTCVPESDAVTPGAEITADDVAEMLSWEGVLGLGEVMDFDGLVSLKKKMIEIVSIGREAGAVIDGHCFLTGRKLAAYVAAGPEADHENFTYEDIVEKLRLGFYAKLRAPTILDMPTVIPRIRNLRNPLNLIFVSDDTMPDILFKNGHLDYVCRSAVEHGMDPVEALRAVTIRPAQHLRLHELGLVAPGRIADIVLLSKLENFQVDHVIQDGRLVVQDGKLTMGLHFRSFSSKARRSVKVSPLTPEVFQITPPVKDGKVKVRAVNFPKPNGKPLASFLELLLTDFTTEELIVKNGTTQLGDLAVVFVIERHGKTRGKGRGFVKNLLQRGAVASSVAHDAHNLVVVGKTQEDMFTAAKTVVESEGGYAVALNSQLLASIELPVAGLMSEEPVSVLAQKTEKFRNAIKSLGMIDHPYMPLLSLLTLSVWPRARITDKGTYSVLERRFVEPMEAA